METSRLGMRNYWHFTCRLALAGFLQTVVVSLPFLMFASDSEAYLLKSTAIHWDEKFSGYPDLPPNGRMGEQRWPQKSEQRYKWIPCLT